MAEKYCQCKVPQLVEDAYCFNCYLKVSPARIEAVKKGQKSEPEFELFEDEIQGPATSTQPRGYINQPRDYEGLSIEAAHRTSKYATLFENVATVFQIINVIGAIILFFAGFAITGSIWIKVAFWASTLVLLAVSYLQTSLVRGVASYFQMKSNAYLASLQKRKN